MSDSNAVRHGLISSHLKGDFAFLLLSLFILMMMYPFLDSYDWGCILLSVGSWYVLFSATWSIHRCKAPYSHILIVLAIMSFLAGAAMSFVLSVSLLKFTAAVRILFYGLAILSILHIIFQGSHATMTRLTIAISGYVLIGLMWANIFSLIVLCDHGAFNISSTAGTPLVQPDYLQIDYLHFNYIYYSFITLTTVGYGDITPVSTLAKTFAYLESLIGQLYLAVLIARLIGIKADSK